MTDNKITLKNSFRPTMQAVTRIWSYGKSQLWYYLPAHLILASQGFLFNLIFAIFLEKTTLMITNKTTDMLLPSLYQMGFNLLGVMAALYLVIILMVIGGTKVSVHLRKLVFGKIIRLPHLLQGEKHSGDYITRITTDVDSALELFEWKFQWSIRPILSGTLCLIAVWAIDSRLAIITIILGIINFTLNATFITPSKRISDTEKESYSKATQRLGDIIIGGAVSRIFNIANKLTGKYGDCVYECKRLAIKRGKLLSWQTGFNTITDWLSFLGIATIGCYFVLRGELAIERLMYVVQMCNGIAWMFSQLGTVLSDVQPCVASSQRVFTLMDSEVERTDGKPIAKAAAKNAVEFNNVSFSYPHTTAKILDGLSLFAKEGETIALVGKSGSGKSTILKLIMGLMHPTEGTIKVWEHDIENANLFELRHNIAYIAQDAHMFDATILDNIAWGNKNATKEQVVEAANAAGLKEFIATLPEGYETQVGDRGTHLSGGQRQRLAIARAIIKDAPILLMDEATSALDSETEALVKHALEVLSSGRTTIVVAHRLSTIKNADCIHVLADGKVIESGGHEELLRHDGQYASMINLGYGVKEAV